MKTSILIFVCAMLCAACAKSPVTLSDGTQGYKVYCDAYRERCVADMERMCGETGYVIVSERAQETRRFLGEIDTGGTWKFNSRYWMEMRCQ